MASNGAIHVDHAVAFLDPPIIEPLMITLEVAMLRVILHRVARMRLIIFRPISYPRLSSAPRIRV